jgi:osmoprotectant transport system permease protein
MNFLGDVVSWFADSDHWTGPSGIPHRLAQHVQYTIVALLAALLVAGPIGVWLGHKRRFGTLAMNVANIGQTLPSFAILVVVVQAVGIGTAPLIGPVALFVAMALLALPPIFTNAYTGVAGVDESVRDAARGMGMKPWQQVAFAEVPVAAPVLLAGIRIAAVQVIATATIGAYTGAGGLGRFIIDGFAFQDYPMVFAGAVLVAALAIFADRVLVFAETHVIPSTRQARRAARAAAVTAKSA